MTIRGTPHTFECKEGSYSFWNKDTLPPAIITTDTKPVTLGMRFQSDKVGKITDVNFYTGGTGSHGNFHIAIFDPAGNIILRSNVSLTLAHPGWVNVPLSMSFRIFSNVIYTVAYYTPVGRYAIAHRGLDKQLISGPLSTIADEVSGVHSYYNGNIFYPNRNFLNSNYFVDVIFVPDK